MTGIGVILGTAAYMSPEQARGKPVDKRADIWAFGCVLFEMLTGRPAFAGQTVTDILAGIIQREPDWNALSSDTAAHITRLLRRCLEKDSRKRLRDIGDARADLDEAGTSPGPPAAPMRARQPVALWMSSAVALAVLSALGIWVMSGRTSTATTPSAPVRLSTTFVEQPHRYVVGSTRLALSRDGLQIAYASANQLWIRRLDQADPVVIGPSATDPFFSPDGAWVGYFGGTSLSKVSVGGGPVTPIADTTARVAGAAWRADGTIVYATTEGLFLVSDQGGTPRQLAKPDTNHGERLYAWPEFLPESDLVLFTILPERGTDPPQLAAIDLKTLKQTAVMKGASSARYVPTGHLVFAGGSTLKAVKFDPTSARSQGEPVSIQGLDVAMAPDNGAADFAVAPSGTLIYLTSRSLTGQGPDGLPNTRMLAWLDRAGKSERIGIAPGPYSYPHVSPDGKRVALDVAGVNRDIWILDLDRLSLTQLTNGPTEDMLPVWSVDGKRIFFASDRTGNFDVYSQAADGATGPKLEFSGPGFQAPVSFTPGGQTLTVYHLFKEIKTLSFDHPDRLDPLLQDPLATMGIGYISPDGKWIAYESTESGAFDIYVRPFPDVAGSREKVSVNGGRYPRWDPKGNQLFYVSLDGDMMAVPFTLSPAFRAGQASRLFAWRKPLPNITGQP